MNTNLLSLSAYLTWKETTGFDSDKSECFGCYCERERKEMRDMEDEKCMICGKKKSEHHNTSIAGVPQLQCDRGYMNVFKSKNILVSHALAKRRRELNIHCKKKKALGLSYEDCKEMYSLLNLLDRLLKEKKKKV